MTQTPQQRRANERFAKHEAAKRGKGPVINKPKQTAKTSISASWLGKSTLKTFYILIHELKSNIFPVILAFVVCGGLILELLKVVPEIWSTVASTISRVTG
ncbi:hypothetical protein N7454_003075 [Penicillium verhagenii]|nr:hypothetical protein N7454_003075 [Penicillium verhagenii]